MTFNTQRTWERKSKTMSNLSISSLSASVAGQSGAGVRPKKSLIQCRVCCGSSWVHNCNDGINVEPAPFMALPSKEITPTLSSANISASSASITPCKSYLFSPKPHCSECSKCSACTNGKQIQSMVGPPPLPSHGVSASSLSSASKKEGKEGTPVLKELKDPSPPQSPQPRSPDPLPSAASVPAATSAPIKPVLEPAKPYTVVPVLPALPPAISPSPAANPDSTPTPSDTCSVSSLEPSASNASLSGLSKRNLTKKKDPYTHDHSHSVPPTYATTDKSAQMDLTTFATLDTPSAVAAVSMSRIRSHAGGSNGLRIANGEDSDDEKDANASGDSSDEDSHSRLAKRSANIKKRVQIMGSADNLSLLASAQNLAASRKLSSSSLADLRNKEINPATATTSSDTSSVSARKPMSMHNLSGSYGNLSQSSKETIVVTNASASSLTNSKSSNPQIITSSPTKSQEFYASMESGTDGRPQHPAVNILSMGSGMLSRKRDTFMTNVTSSGDSGNNLMTFSSLKLQNPFLADSTHLIGDGSMDRDEFPELVDLSTLFGSKASADSTTSRMIWAARIYDGLRKEYLSKPFEEPAFPDRPPSDEIKYRILENFDEGRLTSVTYATRPNGSEYISGGDTEALVDALIFPLNQDNSYTEVFLASYRFFLPASELLTSLIEWYNVELDPSTATPAQESHFKSRGRKQFRSRAARVLLTWIKNHWHDFHVDRELLDELSEFVGDLGEVNFGDGQRMVQAIREQRLSWYMTQYIPPFSAKRAPASESAKPWGILWEPHAFAAQLTLIDHHYFRQIRPDTYLCLLKRSVERGGVGGDDAVKVLMDYVGWFRLVSSYTASLIYKEDTTKKRSKAIKKFIKIARECRDLNNFNTLGAIVHGLKRNIISKMTSAWNDLSAKHVDTFKELEALTDPSNGFGNFWTELKSCGAPLIPFFSAYIHDLLEIHENEPVYIQDLPAAIASDGFRMATTDDESGSANPKEINFTKFYNLYSIVAEIEVWRSYSYNSVIPEVASAANDPKGDTSAVLLNHMRDWKGVEDSILDL